MGEIMGKPAEIREWYKPFKEWNSFCCMEFMNWVANYSEENPDLKLEEAVAAFRMVMDAGYCEEPIYRQPTQIITSAGMLKMAQEILNNSMREVIEKHEHNLI